MWWGIGAGAYAAVGFTVFAFNVLSMPVTFGLALARGVLWPLAWVGLLGGTPMPMD
jgi:hypothetical protein